MFDPVSLTVGIAILWDKHGDSIIEWLQKKAKEKGQKIAQSAWQQFQWQRAEQQYKEKLIKLYGTTRILGNPEPTELTGIFTDLYILTKPLATRRYSIDQLHEIDNEKLHGKEIDRRNGVEIVKQTNSHRLFILGKPGAGKTTFLKYINLQAVQGHIAKTPIFITLREWMDTNKDLMAYIAEQFAICNFPEADSFIDYLLEKGLAIVLFDGLDEVYQQHNPRIINELKHFCRLYDQTQCLITCRVAATDYSFENFNYVEVADFTPDQISVFVSKWFKSEPKKSNQFLLDLAQQQHRGLYELASSPLLLGMLCLAFADPMAFPSRRAELYEDAIDALLRKWDSSRSIKRDEIYHNLTHRLKKQMFAAIAYRTFTNNQYLLPEKVLSDYLERCLKRLPTTEAQAPEGDILLKAIEAQHGIFVERAQKIHSFAHLTFQEYFAASFIAPNPTYQTELLQHITDPRWREVITLTVSLLNDGDDFFRSFAFAIAEIAKTDAQLVDLLQWADTKTKQVIEPYKYSTIRIFYIILALAFALSHTRALALDCDIFLDLAHGLDLDLDLDLALNHALNLNHARFRVPDSILSFALSRAAKSKDMACDYLLVINLLIILTLTTTGYFEERVAKNYDHTFNFFRMSVQQASAWGFNDLASKLSDLMLSFPIKTARQEQWHLFANEFQCILQTQRNIAPAWQLTASQLKTLSDYITANSLFLECLNIATVSDRVAIKNNLLAPPCN